VAGCTRLQARIVILIALLALARKIIVADLFEIAPAALLGLAALALSLGVTYWLVRDSDEGRRGRKDERAPSRSETRIPSVRAGIARGRSRYHRCPARPRPGHLLRG
jgi:hypothetical protein